MKAETHLYEMVYQSMLTQFYNGTLRCGHSLPSQQELCRQYNIGITTIRKVMRMLEEKRIYPYCLRKTGCRLL